MGRGPRRAAPPRVCPGCGEQREGPRWSVAAALADGRVLEAHLCDVCARALEGDRDQEEALLRRLGADSAGDRAGADQRRPA